MENNKILIIGKVRGLTFHACKSKFDNAKNGLSLLGFVPVTFVTVVTATDETKRHYSAFDQTKFDECESVFMLNNWENSRSSKLVHRLAVKASKVIIYQPTAEVPVNTKYPLTDSK